MIFSPKIKRNPWNFRFFKLKQVHSRVTGMFFRICCGMGKKIVWFIYSEKVYIFVKFSPWMFFSANFETICQKSHFLGILRFIKYICQSWIRRSWHASIVTPYFGPKILRGLSCESWVSSPEIVAGYSKIETGEKHNLYLVNWCQICKYYNFALICFFT